MYWIINYPSRKGPKVRIQNWTRITVATCAGLLWAGAAEAQDVADAARANRAKKAARNAEKSANAWYQLTHATLSGGAESDSSLMRFELSSNGEMRIEVEVEEKGKRRTGEIILLKGKRQWMLTRNVPLEPGYEIDMMDGPVLELNLLLEMLRAAVPEGPTTITTKRNVEVNERERNLEVSTASASGGLEAPWSVSGTITPSGEGAWSIDLTVKSTEAVRMVGTWKRSATPPVIADEMPLEGWKVHIVGPTKRTEGPATIYDYGAEPFATKARTAGELRKQ